MRDNFEQWLESVLALEGGYVNHPEDPGGPTNKGVTLKNFRRYVKPNGTVDDLKNITLAQLRVFYRKQYWDVVLADSLPSGVDFSVADFGVNSGPNRSVKHLQTALGTTSDGVVGPNTLEAAAGADAAKVVNDVNDSRMVFLRGLSTFDTFGKGWTARVKQVRADSLALVQTKKPDQTSTLLSIIIAIIRALFVRS